MRVIVLASIGVVFASAPSPRIAELLAQPADFGFRFQVGDCSTEKFDTVGGMFTKDLGGDPPRLVTVQLSLTDAQMRTIYRTIERIRFFDYPSSFSGVPSGLTEVHTFHPASSYRMEVRSGGVVHTVSWKDAYKPTTGEADTLRALFSMILGFIHDHPEFKRLPPSIGGCE